MEHSDIPEILREGKIQMQTLNSWTPPESKLKKKKPKNPEASVLLSLE